MSDSVTRTIVVGANGGIGRALAEHAASPLVEVVGLSRRPDPNWALRQVAVDIEDEATVAAAAAALGVGPPITRILVATGLLHADGVAPEKRNAALDPAAMMTLYAVNAVGPAIVAKHFLPLLPRTGRSLFAVLSARVGSIGDNRLGGWHSYRAAKAALNQLIRTLSIELKRTRPDAILVGLHPGTVATRLSGPFRSAVPDGTLFSPEEAASRLIAVCDALGPEDSGGVFAWNGQRVPD